MLPGLSSIPMATRVQEAAARALDQPGSHPARQEELAIAREALLSFSLRLVSGPRICKPHHCGQSWSPVGYHSTVKWNEVWWVGLKVGRIFTCGSRVGSVSLRMSVSQNKGIEKSGPYIGCWKITKYKYNIIDKKGKVIVMLNGILQRNISNKWKNNILVLHGVYKKDYSFWNKKIIN